MVTFSIQDKSAPKSDINTANLLRLVGGGFLAGRKRTRAVKKDLPGNFFQAAGHPHQVGQDIFNPPGT